jgi:hypothetical protein
MSGCTLRRVVVFSLVLTFGLLPFASAQAVSGERHAKADQQHSVKQTWVGTFWSWVTQVWADETYSGPPYGQNPGHHPPAEVSDDGVGIDPHGGNPRP